MMFLRPKKVVILAFLAWSVMAMAWGPVATDRVLAAEARYAGAILSGPRSPSALVVAEDEIAVLEPFARQVVFYSPDGVLAQEVDITGEARGLARVLDGDYLFCEPGLGRINRVNRSSGQVTLFSEDPVQPSDLLVSGTDVLVLDSATGQIRIFDERGVPLHTVTPELPAEWGKGWFADLAHDPVRDIYYLLDQTNSRILACNREGTFLGSLGSFGSGPGQVSRGGSITCDSEGWIFISDRFQGRIQVFDTDWSFVLSIDPIDFGEERLELPIGLAIDPSGFIYTAACEGSGIHIFHLDKLAAGVPVLHAYPISPELGDPLFAENPQFVAGIQVPADLQPDLGVDFRIVDQSDPSLIIAEEMDVPVTGTTMVGDLIVGTSAWQPDVTLIPGQGYGWQSRARSRDLKGQWAELQWFAPELPLPVFKLEQNTPNPFNPQTVISFTLAESAGASLEIFDIRGRLIQRFDLSGYSTGRQQVVWRGLDDEGSQQPSGIYFYRLMTPGESATRKMVLMK